MNNKKEIAIGFAVGIIANTLGTLIYILLFSDMGIQETIQAAMIATILTALIILAYKVL